MGVGIIGQIALGLGLNKDALKKDIDGLPNLFSGVGGAITKAAGIVGVGLSIKSLVDNFAEAEKGWAKVSTMLGADQSLDKLKQNLDHINKQLPVTGSEIREAAYQALSASVPFEKVGSAVGAAAKGAVGGFTSVNIALDGMTSVMNSYNEAAVGSQLALKDYNYVMDLFVQTQNRGKTTVGELASAIGRVAPTAAGMGLSFIDLSAALATTTAKGIQTAEAVTGINAMLANIAKPSDIAIKAANDLGIEFGSVAMKSQGLGNFLNGIFTKMGATSEAINQISHKSAPEFKKKFEEMGLSTDNLIKKTSTGQLEFTRLGQKMAAMVTNGSDNVSMLTKLFGSMQAVNTVLAMASDEGELYNRNLTAMKNATGTADEAARKMTETFSGQCTLLKNNLNPLLQDLGGAIVKQMIPWIKEGIKFLQDNREVLVKNFVEVIENAGQAIQVLLPLIPKLTSMIGTMNSVLDKAGGAWNIFRYTVDLAGSTAHDVAMNMVKAKSGIDQALKFDLKGLDDLIQYFDQVQENEAIYNMKEDLKAARGELEGLRNQYKLLVDQGKNEEAIQVKLKIEEAQRNVQKLLTEAQKLQTEHQINISTEEAKQKSQALADEQVKIQQVQADKQTKIQKEQAWKAEQERIAAEEKAWKEITKIADKSYSELIKKNKLEFRVTSNVDDLKDFEAKLKEVIKKNRGKDDGSSYYFEAQFRLQVDKQIEGLQEAVKKEIPEIEKSIKFSLSESLAINLAESLKTGLKSGLSSALSSFFDTGKLDFSKLGSALKNSITSSLASSLSDGIGNMLVGQNGRGGILGTITGALGISGPVGMAIVGGISTLWSIFGNKPKEEDLFNKIGTEIRTAFSSAMVDFWNDFRDKAAEALSDVGSDKSELIKDSFQGLFDSVMEGLGDSFDFDKFKTALINGADDMFSQVQVMGWLDGNIDWGSLSSEVQNLITTFFRNYQIGIEDQITNFLTGWNLQLQQMQSAGLISQEQYDQAMDLIQQYSDTVRANILPYFEEFQTNMKLDPDNVDYYFQQLQTKLAWAFEIMGDEFGSYQDLIDVLSRKLANTATQAGKDTGKAYAEGVEEGVSQGTDEVVKTTTDMINQISKKLEENTTAQEQVVLNAFSSGKKLTEEKTEEVKEILLRLLKAGILTSDELVEKYGQSILTFLGLISAEAGKTAEAAGQAAAEGITDGMSAGLEGEDPLLPIQKAIEAVTTSAQRSLLNAYQAGKELTADGMNRVKSLLEELLESGAVTTEQLVQMYGSKVLELLGIVKEEAKKTAEDVNSQVPGLSTGGGSDLTDEDRRQGQINQVKDTIAAIQKEYDGYYATIAQRADSITASIKSRIQTEITGIQQVITAMTDRYNREMKFINKQNEESLSSLEKYISTVGKISGLMGEYEEAEKDIAKQQSEIWSDFSKNISDGISDLEKAIKSSTNLTKEQGDVNKENVSYLESILKNFESIEDILKPINKENQNYLDTILKNYDSIDDILKTINKSNGDNLKYLIEQSDFEDEISDSYKDRLKGILLIANEESKAAELKKLALELQEQGIDVSRLDLETQDEIKAMNEEQIESFKNRLSLIKTIGNEEQRAAELKKLALELQEQGIDISQLDLETQDNLNSIQESQINAFKARLAVIKTITDEEEKQSQLQKLIQDMKSSGFDDDLTLKTLETMQGLTEAEKEYYLEKVKNLNQITDDIEKQAALESLINELKTKGVEIDFESLNALAEVNKLSEEYQAKFLEVKKQIEEEAKSYNQEELENLKSVNDANLFGIQYKLQQAQIDETLKANLISRLGNLSMINDQELKQQELMKIAAEMKAAGIDIDLEDYQLIKMKTDLTADEVKAMAEKANLAEEAIKDMNEDLEIQRDRLTTIGVPSLELEQHMALLKQERLKQIAEELGISLDQLSVMDSQLLRTEEQKKANLEIAQQQLQGLDDELAKMKENGASQEDINQRRLEALRAIASNLGLEYSQLDGLLTQNENLRAAEEEKLAYQRAQLDALNGIQSAVGSMRDSMAGLTTAIQNAATVISQSLTTALAGAAFQAGTISDAVESVNEVDFTPFVNNLTSKVAQAKAAMAGLSDSSLGFGLPEGSYAAGAYFIPRDMTANLHKGELVAPAKTAELVRDSGLIKPNWDVAIPVMQSQLAETGRIVEVNAPITFSGNYIKEELDIMELTRLASHEIAKDVKRRTGA